MSNIDELMYELSEARACVDVLRMRMNELIDNVITSEQRVEIAAIEAEFEPQMETADANAKAAEIAVKTAVLDLGKSYKAAGLNAVYGKPRVRWDTKAIDGYAINHPELFAFRTEGKPSVSIRLVK